MDEDVSLYIRTVFPLERMAITLVLYRRLIQFVILRTAIGIKPNFMFAYATIL